MAIREKPQLTNEHMREVINHLTHIHLLNTIKFILTHTLEKFFTSILWTGDICPSSSFYSRNYYVCILYGFITKEFHDLHRVMNWRTLQPTSFSSWWSSYVLGSDLLVSHVLEVVHWKREIVTTEQVQLGIGVRVQL